jgi:hypothetical protein
MGVAAPALIACGVFGAVQHSYDIKVITTSAN